MIRSRAKLVLGAMAATAAIAMGVFAFRAVQLQTVPNLSQEDVIKIHEVVRHRQWQEVLPDYSWKSLSRSPRNLFFFCISRHRLCAVSRDGDSAGVATWHGGDQNSGFMDIDWLEKRDGHWQTVRRSRHVRRAEWQSITNPPPILDLPILPMRRFEPIR